MNRFLWASYGMYLLGGSSSVFFGAVMPELLSHYHVTYTAGGFLALLGAVGFVVGVPITAALMKRFHYRFILSASALAVAAAQIGVCFLPNFLWVHVLVVLNGMGAAALETAVASYVMELFPGRRAIFMSRLEVSFGVGALSLPAIASALIAVHVWRFTSLFIGVFALVLALVWQFVSVSLESSQSDAMSGSKDARTAPAPKFTGKLSKYSTLMMFLVMILIYVGVEGSLNNFLPSVFLVYLKARPYAASLSSSAFWGAMVVGRLGMGWLVQRISYERYLFGSIAAGFVFFLLLTQSHIPWFSYATVLGLGFGLSAVYSITMVYANHTFPGMERMVTSAITAFAGLGGAVFPAVIGYAMDHLFPRQVMLLILGFIVILLAAFLTIYFSLLVIRGRSLRLE